MSSLNSPVRAQDRLRDAVPARAQDKPLNRCTTSYGREGPHVRLRRWSIKWGCIKAAAYAVLHTGPSQFRDEERRQEPGPALRAVYCVCVCVCMCNMNCRCSPTHAFSHPSATDASVQFGRALFSIMWPCALSFLLYPPHQLRIVCSRRDRLGVRSILAQRQSTACIGHGL